MVSSRPCLLKSSNDFTSLGMRLAVRGEGVALVGLSWFLIVSSSCGLVLGFEFSVKVVTFVCSGDIHMFGTFVSAELVSLMNLLFLRVICPDPSILIRY